MTTLYHTFLFWLMNISTLFGNNFTNSKNIPSAPVDNLKVLFIGNSYTFRNDVPGKVEKLAEAANLTLEAQVAAKGGWNLKKHSDFFEPEYLETSEKIKNPPDGGWDVVVINEQSQRTSKSIEKMCRDTFQYALILTNEIRKYSPNAKIQWYVTWARAIGDNKNCKDNKQVCTFNGMQNAITTTYESLACMTRPSQLAPVGEAFREFRKLYQNEFFDLYKGWFEPGDCYEPKSGPKCHGTDEWDHHASNMGSYLSACVHFSTLFGVPCKGNTFRGDPKRECRINNEKTANCQIDVDTTLKLQTAADNVVQQGGWKYIEDASHCTNHFENECVSGG